MLQRRDQNNLSPWGRGRHVVPGEGYINYADVCHPAIYPARGRISRDPVRHVLRSNSKYTIEEKNTYGVHILEWIPRNSSPCGINRGMTDVGNIPLTRRYAATSPPRGEVI